MKTQNKPAGIPVFPPHADPLGACVLAELLERDPWRRSFDWPDGFAGGIAHRLDVATSGALLVADDPSELRVIRDWFSKGLLTKIYRLKAARDVPWAEHSCDRPIAHDRRKRKRMIVQRGQATPHRGRWYPAQTWFRRLHGRVFEARMRSGVMHQIRVHAAFLGIPLQGDRLYGGGAPVLDEDAPGRTFFLHHVQMRGPDGWCSERVPMPQWAVDSQSRRPRDRS